MRGYLIRRAAQLVPVLLGIAPRHLPHRAAGARRSGRHARRHDAPEPRGASALPRRAGPGRVLARPVRGHLEAARRRARSTPSGRDSRCWRCSAERLPITGILIAGAIALSLLVGVPLGVLSARRPYGRLDNWLSVARARRPLAAGLLVRPRAHVGVRRRPARVARQRHRAGHEPAYDRARHGAVLRDAHRRCWRAGCCRRSCATRAAPCWRRSRRTMCGPRGARDCPSRWCCTATRSGMRCCPVVTVVGLLVPVLIGSTAVIESVFAMPGIGRLVVEAALNRDYPDDHDPQPADRRRRAGEHARRRRALRRPRSAHRASSDDVARTSARHRRRSCPRAPAPASGAGSGAASPPIGAPSPAPSSSPPSRSSALLAPMLAPYDPTEQRAGRWRSRRAWRTRWAPTTSGATC